MVFSYITLFVLNHVQLVSMVKLTIGTYVLLVTNTAQLVLVLNITTVLVVFLVDTLKTENVSNTVHLTLIQSNIMANNVMNVVLVTKDVSLVPVHLLNNV